MAQHLKYWYQDHRDRDRPASEAMEPSKLEDKSQGYQQDKLGYRIAPSWTTIGRAGSEMMRNSLNAATRAIKGTRGEAINVTLTSGHGTQDTHLSLSNKKWQETFKKSCD